MREYFIWLFKLITVVFIFVILVPVFIAATAKVLESTSELSTTSKGKKIAVIELKGEIDDAKDVTAQLYKQADNKDVKGIVLRIDSPGGSVAPSQDIFEAVKAAKAKKPVVASMGALAASGGLYSAVGATKVFAEPGTLTGSIGVIMQVPNFTKVTEKIGVEMITIKSGARKDSGNPFRTMTEEEKVFLQGTLADVHEQFITAVAEGRGLDKETVRKFADGRVITGMQAKELKLIDEFGDVYAAAREIFKIRNEPLAANENPELYYPGEKFGHFKELLKAYTKIPGVLSPKAEIKYLLTF